MSQAPASMTVFIPLTIRRRDARPKTVPPTNFEPANDGGVDPHILKAIAKAWSWRRRLESGQSATIEDIARAEDVSPSFVRRTLKLAYLAPAVLEQILIGGRHRRCRLRIFRSSRIYRGAHNGARYSETR